MGIEASAEGLDWLLSRDELPQIVFDATSAKAHRAAAPRLEEAGIVAVDLTPAAVGPLVSPPVNFRDHVDAMNINMISCGAQATVPIVHAVSSVVPVAYAEIVASVASKSAGPGTRANIDEFTHTTSRAVRELGGTTRGKAIIVLNPVEPPMIMRDTIFCAIPADADHDAITESVRRRVAEVQEYVPGYTLRAEPQYDDPREKWDGNGRVTVFIEVLGAGDYLPTYAGNLDIMTAAAARVGELVATTRFVGAGQHERHRAPGADHRHDAARRQPRDVPRVHRGAGARHGARSRRRRRRGDRGQPRRRHRRLVVQLRLLEGRRHRPGARGGRGGDPGEDRRPPGPGHRHHGRPAQRPRGRRLGGPDRDPLHRGGCLDPALRAGQVARDGDRSAS